MYSWIAFPLLRITLLFSAGIVLAIELPPSVSRTSVVIGVICTFAVYLLLWWVYGHSKFFSLNLLFGTLGHLLIVMCGYATLLIHNDQYDYNHMLNRQEVTAYHIKIIDQVDNKEKSIRMLGGLISVRDSVGWKPTIGKVFIYIRKGEIVSKVSYGDVLLIGGSPERTQSPKNPGEFDYQLYLSYQNIYHQDFIQEGEFTIVDQNQGSPVYSFALQSRLYLKNILREYIGEDRERVIALALLLGTKDELTPEINQAYASAGAMHVLAVSGLHVGIIYGLMLFFFKKSQKGKFIKWIFLAVTLSGLCSYALITGLSASVLRAVTMFSLMTIAKVAKRESNIYNTLSAAGLILLCYNPYLIMAIGFQLSFLAVFGIVYITPKIYQLLSVDQYLLDKVWQVTCVSIAAQIATAPLVLLYFHQFPTYFFLSSLVVIPAAFAILVSGIALFAFEMIPYVNDLLGWILEKLIYLMNEFVFLIERLPNNTIDDLYINITQSWLIIMSIMFFFAWIYYKRLYQLITLSLIVISFVWIKEWRVNENLKEKKIVFYSVGQHTAIDFMQGNQATLITDSSLVNNKSKARFHIKPNRLRAGIINPIVLASPDDLVRNVMGENELIIWNGERILILKKYSNQIEKIQVDVMVVTNNSIYDMSQLSNMNFEKLIIDGSNSHYRADKLSSQAEVKGISVINLMVDGAYQLVL